MSSADTGISDQLFNLGPLPSQTTFSEDAGNIFRKNITSEVNKVQAGPLPPQPTFSENTFYIFRK